MQELIVKLLEKLLKPEKLALVKEHTLPIN